MTVISQSSSCYLLLLPFLFLFFGADATGLNTTTTTVLEAQYGNVRTVCRSTPYPQTCFDSLKLTITENNINLSVLTYVLRTLQVAIIEANKLSGLLATTTPGSGTIIEKHRGSIQDCKDLHQITISSLKKANSILQSNQRKPSDVNTYLSAALTNKNTCLEGLDEATGPLKPVLIQSVTDAYKHVSNSLSLVTGSRPPAARGNRRLSGWFPAWMSGKDRRLLQSSDHDEYESGLTLTVAGDGSGNFTRIVDAIGFAPNNSVERTFIYVREGVYEENVFIPTYKTNLMLIGDGSNVTVIRGNRSVVDGWTTFSSATVAVSGEGFLARNLDIENVAGPQKGQSVALRVNADFVAFYQCAVAGYQDTLYVHSFRQFYRECNVSGTIDFIFGNAAVIFQAGNIIARKPLPGQANVMTAQARDDPNQDTGISIQNCSVLASSELLSYVHSTRSYLGRPWMNYSVTVYLESYIDQLVDPAGWTRWQGNQGLDTLYYGEYANRGPGSNTSGRVTWPGYHLMGHADALNFTASQLLAADEWLPSTTFPYDDGI